MSQTLPQTDLVTVTIDGVDVRVPKGTLLVEAAKAIKTEIPVYCYHTKLGPAGLCRVCLVDIEGMPKLQIACNTPVADGMKVHTQNAKANEGRRAILEFLLLNHPLDCPICDKGGECDLQDFSMAFGQGASRLVDAKDHKPKAVDLGPTIVLDEERCILCLRCVRFDDIITGERSLRTDDRGAHAIIATATGEPYVSDFSGNVTELCPVGALTSKTYRFRSRPWDNHRTQTTCTQCSVGCQMNVDERGNLITRTMSVQDDDAISDGWLCDRGRYNIGFVNDERRLTQPLLRHDGDWTQIAWDDAIALWADALRAAIANGGASSVGVIGGGRLLNEEAFLLQHVHRALGVGNLDWRAGRAVQAHPGPIGATHVEVENAQAIVIYGRSPAALAPVLDLRIRKAVSRNGARVMTVGDRSPQGQIGDNAVASFADVRAQLPEGAQRIVIVWDGTAIADAPALFDLAGELRAAGTSVGIAICGEQPNARGAEAMGMLPDAGALDTRGMLEAARDGKIGVLALLGANPLLHFPDRALVDAALAATPFVVVTELFLTETAARASLVLPVCSAFEKSGTTIDFAGDVLPVNGAVVAPADVRADGDILVALADALGVALPDPIALETRVAEAATRIPQRAFGPQSAASRSAAPVNGQAAPIASEHVRLVVDAAIFTGGGTSAFDARVAALRAMPRAWMHPSTARLLQVSDGSAVDIDASSGDASLTGLFAAVSDRIAPGTVAIVDGLPEAPANVLRSGGAVHVRAARIAATVGE